MQFYSYNILIECFASPFASLEKALEKIAFLEGQKFEGASVVSQFRTDGFSSLLIQFDEKNFFSIGFAPLFSGNYCIRIKCNDETHFDIYNKTGRFVFRQSLFNETPLYVDLLQMDPHCVFTSHLYNILSFEYAQADKAEANIERVQLIENIVRKIAHEHYSERRFLNLNFDSGFCYYNQKLIETEETDVLRFDERQKIRKKLISERKILINVKSRVHKLTRLQKFKNTWYRKAMTQWKVVKQKPSDVFKNTCYRYTIGVMLWFFSVVRNNIGYSIALAVYGPFTFYFITQPMNPHAMWAVGKVRNTYIESINFIKKELSQLGLYNVENIEVAKVAEAATDSNTNVLTTNEGNRSTTTNTFKPVANASATFEKYTPKTLGILVNGEVKSIAEQTWSERMSNFKDMQIGYEENLQFSERMGRLEQMESQLNFPLIAESSYRETERYLNKIESLSMSTKNIDLKDYLKKEKFRTVQTQIYIWDRLVRFILDHQYIMMDISDEQRDVDYYMGRSFLFLKEITDDLRLKYKNLPKPKNYSVIEALAKKYDGKKQNGRSIEERLQKNSLLSSQKDFFSTQEMREHIKRQWEILFLLQNKAQEAANFGLQTYTWSVRNALWVLQSIYSNKRRDIDLIAHLFETSDKNSNTGNSNIRLTELKYDSKKEIKEKIEPLYESLFHILTMEFVSIKTEIGERLNNDIEALQRKVIIENTENFFKDRQTLLSRLN